MDCRRKSSRRQWSRPSSTSLPKTTPKRHFTVGIVDDVTHLSLAWDPSFRTEADDVSASVFYGLGADGTVGANKNSIKIVGQETELFAQGYFVYDSKKSGAITVSHLRTSKRPIRSAYLVDRAGFVACHQFEFVDKIDVLEHAAPGSAFLLNAPFPAERGLGPPAEGDAGTDHRKEDSLLCDRRLRPGEARRHGHAHQYDHADLLLRDLGPPARATKRSPTSRNPSRRPTASADPRSYAGTARSSTRRSLTCTRSACPPRSARATAVRRSFPSGRPISSRR